MPVNYQDKIRQLGAMKHERQSWDSHYLDLQDFFLPRRGRWLERGKNSDSSQRGQKMNQKLLDPTPRFAARTLAAGMHAGSTNPSTPWIKPTLADTELLEYPPVARWLDVVAQRMRDVFERSNLYSVLPMIYQDAGVFGTSVMTILEHDEKIIHCVPSPTGSFYLGTNYDGDVDTKFCEYKQTTEQMVAQYGFENCSEKVQSDYTRKNFMSQHDVLHIIEPNRGREYGRVDAAHMPFSSCYLELGTGRERTLKESGFEDNPLAALRWEVTEITDPYGASPGMDALGLSKALQVQTRQKGKAIDKHVDPPMVGDPALQNQSSTLLPGGITYAGFTATGSAPKFQPAYTIKPELGGSLEDIRDIRNVIAEAMYTDLFLAITRAVPRNATAEEIAARYQEKILLLGPVLQNHRDGLIKPLFDRTFYIMMRQGMLPPPPPELEGEDIKVEMTGMLFQALKAVASTGIERFVAFGTRMAELQAAAGEAPTALDKLDVDQAMDEYGISIGVPPTLIRSDEDVAKIRDNRAKQQQAQAAAAAAQPIEQGAKAAKALSETKLATGESALDAMVGAQ